MDWPKEPKDESWPPVGDWGELFVGLSLMGVLIPEFWRAKNVGSLEWDRSPCAVVTLRMVICLK
jgi:hypothetical protein